MSPHRWPIIQFVPAIFEHVLRAATELSYRISQEIHVASLPVPPRCSNQSVSNFRHKSKQPVVRFGSRLCENVHEQRMRRIVFSLFFFDGDCQSGSFLIQRNRDKLSTRKFDVGVFTQPGSKADLWPRMTDVCFTPENGHR